MKAIGIILAGGSSRRLGDLSRKRATSAMPVGGSYRCIDFALSNMSNSHIQTVAVLTQYNSRSLNEHLSSSKWWDFGRKQGGLYLFTPTITMDNSDWFRGTADAMYQNLDYLKKRHEPYVIICSGDCVWKMDFGQLLEYHVAKNADITIACTDVPPETDISRYGVLTLDEEDRVVEFEEKPIVANGRTVSMGVYVLRRRQLIEMLEQTIEEERYNFVQDVLIRYRNVKRIFGYRFHDYWKNIASTEDYYQANMDFLRPEIRRRFFKEEPHIYSKVDDLPPAKYNPGSEVGNSLISSGCIINGTVENSVLFKTVYMGNGSTVRNCVILNDVYIGDNSYLENCIVDSRCALKPNAYFKGEGGIEVVTDWNNKYKM